MSIRLVVGDAAPHGTADTAQSVYFRVLHSGRANEEKTQPKMQRSVCVHSEREQERVS